MPKVSWGLQPRADRRHLCISGFVFGLDRSANRLVHFDGGKRSLLYRTPRLRNHIRSGIHGDLHCHIVPSHFLLLVDTPQGTAGQTHAQKRTIEGAGHVLCAHFGSVFVLLHAHVLYHRSVQPCRESKFGTILLALVELYALEFSTDTGLGDYFFAETRYPSSVKETVLLVEE